MPRGRHLLLHGTVFDPPPNMGCGLVERWAKAAKPLILFFCKNVNMKYLFLAALLLGLQQVQAQNDEDKTKEEEPPSVSYSLGMLMASQLQGQIDPDEINPKELAKGFEDMLRDKSKYELQAANDVFSKYMQSAQAKAAEKEKAAEVAYFAELEKKKGIQKTDGGLYYEVLQEGDGPQPSLSSKVKTHYHGTLIDGTVFDSSVERGQPATFPVNGVIKGWQEILPMMPVGSKWRVHIPFEKAYGSRATGRIPAFSTLIFEIELLEIVE